MVKLRIVVLMMLISCMSISSADSTITSNVTIPINQINTQIFGLAPGGSIIPMLSRFVNASIHPKFFVENIGRRPVHAKVWKTDQTPYEEISGTTINPGQRVALENYNVVCRETRLAVYNYDKARAIFYVGTGEQIVPNNPPWNYNVSNVLIQTFNLGVKSLPPTSKGPLALLLKFWPAGKPNIWQQIFTATRTVLMDPNLINIVKEVIDVNLDYINKQVITLNTLVENNDPSCRFFYMNLVEVLSKLPNKFRLTNPDINDIQTVNFVLVPFYTLAVTFMTAFYALGIANPNTYKLNPGDVQYLNITASNFIYGQNGSIDYVENMYNQQVDFAYREVYTGALYNPIMNVRNYVILSALEAIPLWVQAVQNPQSNKQPYIGAISYSHFFGRATPNIFSQALPISIACPLTPGLKTDGRREKLISIHIYCRLVGTDRIIVGVKLYFEYNNYILGFTTNDYDTLNLNGATIKSLKVYGIADIDSLIFSLSDDRQIHFGSAHHNNFVDFQLEDHHIAGFYLVNDVSSVAKVSSIAVSYQLNELERS